MNSYDHYPWLSVQPPPMPTPTPPTFDARYGVYFCLQCNLALEYCKGHASPDSPAQDGADSDLARRIAEARTQAGGR